MSIRIEVDRQYSCKCTICKKKSSLCCSDAAVRERTSEDNDKTTRAEH